MIRLGELTRGASAKIVKVEGESETVSRLMEMGLLEGSVVEVLHEAPFSRDPIAVRVRGTLIALRRGEANHVWVETAREGGPA